MLPADTPWHLIVDGAHPGAVNMERDVELLERSPRPALRIYGWVRPTLSLGYSQRDDWVDQERLRALGVDVVRRPSGGRALLHHDELTYAVVLPDAAGLTVGQAFCAITRSLAQALRAVGIPAQVCGQAEGPEGRACMARTRPGELISPRGKLVGSAQVRRGARLLQHGSIPLRVDAQLLERVLPGHPPLFGLAELGAHLSAPELARAWGEAMGVTWWSSPSFSAGL